MSVTIRLATASDATALSELAAKTFTDTFAEFNSREDMARFLEENFSPQKQAAEIADCDYTVMLAEAQTANGKRELAGYVQMVRGPAPMSVSGQAPIEIKRIYVAKQWHGQRIAQALMDAAIASARSVQARTIWLGVWERNPRAVAFYAKYGFERVGEHVFKLGNDEQTDWLLARPL